MTKKRGWSQMDVSEKLEALKSDLDQLYDMFAAHEQTQNEFESRTDKNVKLLAAYIAELQEKISVK